MQIHIEEDGRCAETRVVIRCRQMDGQIAAMLAQLRAWDAKLTGEKDGQTYLLNARDVLYADTADKRTFLYTDAQVYETPLRLYELEDRLASQGFLRAGKSCILNFDKIRSLRPDFGGRLVATMENGEAVVITRQYAPAVKSRLGL